MLLPLLVLGGARSPRWAATHQIVQHRRRNHPGGQVSRALFRSVVLYESLVEPGHHRRRSRELAGVGERNPHGAVRLAINTKGFPEPEAHTPLAPPVVAVPQYLAVANQAEVLVLLAYAECERFVVQG